MQRAAGHVLASRRYASEPRQQRGAPPSPPPAGEGWEGARRVCETYRVQEGTALANKRLSSLECAARSHQARPDS